MNAKMSNMDDILLEMKRAEQLHPDWPSDPVHAAAIVCEESGELVQAALDYQYGRSPDTSKIRAEAVQTAAMALRLLRNLKE